MILSPGGFVSAHSANIALRLQERKTDGSTYLISAFSSEVSVLRKKGARSAIVLIT